MQATDIIIFVAIMLALGAAWYFLHRSEGRTKNKHKMTAYNLLEQENPDPKKIKETLRLLRLYGGHWRRDREFAELGRLLSDLLNEIEKSGAAPSKSVRQ